MVTSSYPLYEQRMITHIFDALGVDNEANFGSRCMIHTVGYLTIL